jgi:ferredoxin
MTLIPEIHTFACVAHGDCAAVAPEAFRVDDVAVVIGTGADDRLREAARACRPERSSSSTPTPARRWTRGAPAAGVRGATGRRQRRALRGGFGWGRQATAR